MPVGMLGRKIGMTQVYDETGKVYAVTVVEAGPCTVLQVRTSERDRYSAVVLGFDDKLSQADKARPESERKRTRAIRSERGSVVALASKRAKKRESAGIPAVPKAGCEPQRFIREFRTDGEQHTCEVGQKLTAKQFDGVKYLDVVSTSKGRGFSGVMKRHNFSGTRATHGVKKAHRKPGSIGNNTFPSRVWKGKRMAGQMGNHRVTVRNLKVVRIDDETGMVLLHGSVPGPIGGYVILRQAD